MHNIFSLFISKPDSLLAFNGPLLFYSWCLCVCSVNNIISTDQKLLCLNQFQSWFSWIVIIVYSRV
jgi:hypothetical protein